MPTKPGSRCPVCKRIHSGTGKCLTCRGEVRRAGDRARGSAAARGYGAEHRERFRVEVLRRDPVCVLCRRRLSTVADHWPLSRRELVMAGLDPNDWRHGRGLCASCHGVETAANPKQRGGWNRRIES